MGGFGAALVASLFLDWYRGASGRTLSAWEAFAVVDLFLLVTGLLALVALVLTLAQRTPAVPLALTSIATLVAMVAAVLVLVRLLAAPEVPGAGSGEVARLFGAWLGAAATLGLLAAMLAAIRDERAGVGGGARAGADGVRTLTLPSARGDGRGAPTPSEPEGVA